MSPATHPDRTRRTTAPAVAWSLCAFALCLFAAPAWAQQQTFSDDFENPNGNQFDSTKWPSGNRGAGARVVSGSQYVGSGNGNQVVYFNTGSNRFLGTAAINMSAGGSSLAFDIRYVPSGGTTDSGAFSDAMDSTGDDIKIEYSLNNSTWTTLDTFAYNDSRMSTSATGGAWYSASVTLTSITFGTTTYFRWAQLGGNSNNNNDNWAIDNVAITYNEPIPEPGTWALFGTAAAGLGAWVVKRRRARLAAAKA